jgi:hypothetical protein
MTAGLSSAIVRSLRRAALPLAAYYAVTLALPLANGAARAGAPFVEHALVVLVVPPVLVVLWRAGQAWGQVVNRQFFHALARRRAPCRAAWGPSSTLPRRLGSGLESSLFSRSDTSPSALPWQGPRGSTGEQS